MDSRRTRNLIQYTLAAAGQEEPGQRELGPIHLIKYLYLADLAHAKDHGGQTFTGARWRFHHFGPWTAEVYRELEPATHEAHARHRRFQGPYDDDVVRWSVRDEELLESLEAELPRHIRGALKRLVHEYGNDTSGLLHHVYLTPPMLRAAPGEVLDFSTAAESGQEDGADARTRPQPEQRLSAQEQERRKAALERLRSRVREAIRARREEKKVAPIPPPQYDEVFFEGLRWLDNLAGEPIEPEAGELIFADTVWKDPSRSDPGIP